MKPVQETNRNWLLNSISFTEHKTKPIQSKKGFFPTDMPYHLHPEFEIRLKVLGGGQKLVGDHFETYHSGDLTLIGPQLPHMFKNWSNERSHAQLIHFRPAILEGLLSLPEFSRIADLLKTASRGIFFPKKDNLPLINLFNAVRKHRRGPASFAALILLLDAMSQSTTAQPLSSPSFSGDRSEQSLERFNRMIHFIEDHYHEPIHLHQIAEVGHLHPQSVSRFFVKQCGQSFQAYLIETRLTRAARQLMETPLGIAEIAFQCGFNSLANFNRLFLKRYQQSPKQYRDTIHGASHAATPPPSGHAGHAGKAHPKDS